MRTDWGDVALWVALVAIVVGGFFIIRGMIVSSNETEAMSNLCITGGHAYSTNLAGVDLCIGVIDGEWQIEPLDDVRARLEGE